ncbi:MAG: M10 family metallopeptidase C-terminal domain-containing protein [Rhodobacteraceae bacterium]|nr:M10 family metallopeptidase C-terminal domain-containing protein [Paracoccaceae bacterium]
MTVDITLPSEQDDISLQELSLYHAITEYRSGLGLEPIRLSKALSTTAGRHVLDTRENIWAEGVELPEDANLHSWSDAFYYTDHRAPEVMWEAPARVGTDYGSAGYEISAAGFPTVETALEGWQGSASHNAVLANLDVWADVEFLAIGIGVDTTPGAGIYAGRIFHVWFGEALDAAVPEIVGSPDSDGFVGTAFDDLIHGRGGDDEIRADRGDDEVRGGSGQDRMWGNSGDDMLNGGDGDDRLTGGSGDDRVLGADGDDTLIGRSGSDHLTGDLGADVFYYNDIDESEAGSQRDVIADFERGRDRIDLTSIDARDATDRHDAFEFIGTSRFSERSGELRRSDGLIEGDVDGDGEADFQIELRAFAVLEDVDTDGDGIADSQVEVSMTPLPAPGDFLI